MSSTEAEFKALAHGICEATWLKRLPEELKVIVSPPIKVYCDNKVVISIARNPVLHDRAKHVEVDKHLIKLDSGMILFPISLPRNKLLTDPYQRITQKGSSMC